jgi:hypothetical protein
MVSLSDVYNFTLGTSALAQLFQYVVIFWLVYVILRAGKDMTNVVGVYSQSSTALLPYLYDGPQVIMQDPNQKGSNTIYPSVNAPAGLEFSYSCFLLINKATFQGSNDSLRHVFHKGSSNYKPLMCPGVFVRNNDNSLVVYMNEAGSWDTNCELPNMPVGKFFHLAIVVRNMDVDVYINGNVAHRMKLKTIPKQNFGDLYVFKNETFSDAAYSQEHPFKVSGAASGLISRLLYSSYALNYEQIDRMVRAGPSTQMVSATQNLPPYLADNWWVSYYSA